MRALWIAKANRWRRGIWFGGWTVAFSKADKSKKEWVVINVPKWPRVTDRPSPVTALKRGHLNDHPSHRHTQKHCYKLVSSVCVCLSVNLLLMLLTIYYLFSCYIKAYKQAHANTPCIYKPFSSLWIQLMDTLASVLFHSWGSWTLNTRWVAQEDHWPLEEDIWPPFFSNPVLGTRQSDTNALLIGLCFTMSIAPLSARQLSPLIYRLGKGPLQF